MTAIISYNSLFRRTQFMLTHSLALARLLKASTRGD